MLAAFADAVVRVHRGQWPAALGLWIEDPRLEGAPPPRALWLAPTEQAGLRVSFSGHREADTLGLGTRGSAALWDALARPGAFVVEAASNGLRVEVTREEA